MAIYRLDKRPIKGSRGDEVGRWTDPLLVDPLPSLTRYGDYTWDRLTLISDRAHSKFMLPQPKE